MCEDDLSGAFPKMSIVLCSKTAGVIKGCVVAVAVLVACSPTQRAHHPLDLHFTYEIYQQVCTIE